MFVQAVDGRLYENPIIASIATDKVKYYIKIEDMERPIINIDDFSGKLTVSSSRRWALRVFNVLGMKAKLPQKALTTDYAPHLSVTWEFELLRPIPVPNGYNSVVNYPRADAAFMAWEMEFDKRIIVDFVEFDKYNSILVAFILGKDVIAKHLTNDQLKFIKKNLERELITTDRLSETIKLKRN